MEQPQHSSVGRKPDNTSKPLRRGSHTEDLVDHYWGSINYVFSLIKASEVKAGLILSFYGILLNFLYKNISYLLLVAADYFVIYGLLAIWIGLTMGSIYFSIRCFMPRIESKFDKNMFFFGDVISKYGTIKEFSKTFYKISLDEVELFDQMGQQIFINSKIAAVKFKNVNRAIRLLAFSLVILFLLLVSVLFISDMR
ncbi:Pycsar system effector family protein [Arenibacter latericius]|uniref:Pycsar system effector family protein n=1 Tax=Arenibacter latericius TaxID=86104 RepID=UPI00040F5ABB|nr:Pycsar system effector family protein [Arenibacter latericius]